MSNLSGYCDYNGPSISSLLQTLGIDSPSAANGIREEQTTADWTTTTTTQSDGQGDDNDDNHEDDDDSHNPLQVGFWMEGDSLAPPCGTSLFTIHNLLRLAQVTSRDVLYDLGCGDGRICFEAWAGYQCQVIVGVEVEQDLVQKFESIAQTQRRTLVNLQQSSSAVAFSSDKDKEKNKYDDRSENHEIPNEQKIILQGKQIAPLPIILQDDLRQVLRQLFEQTTSSSNTTMGTTLENNNEEQETKDALPFPTILIMYLLPEAMEQIQPYLIQLLSWASHQQQDPNKNANLRILCNTWGLSQLTPVQVYELSEPGGTTTTNAFLYNTSSLPRKVPERGDDHT